MLVDPGDPTFSGMVRAVIDNPEDDTPKLVFADYLQERDDPRQKLLRVCTALKNFSPFVGVYPHVLGYFKHPETDLPQPGGYAKYRSCQRLLAIGLARHLLRWMFTTKPAPEIHWRLSVKVRDEVPEDVWNHLSRMLVAFELAACRLIGPAQRDAACKIRHYTPPAGVVPGFVRVVNNADQVLKECARDIFFFRLHADSWMNQRARNDSSDKIYLSLQACRSGTNAAQNAFDLVTSFMRDFGYGYGAADKDCKAITAAWNALRPWEDEARVKAEYKALKQ